jgi:lipid-binding SYLF domain-containing protein
MELAREETTEETPMKKLLILLCIAGMSTPAFCASDVEKLDSRLDNARAVIDEIMATPDKAIPDSIATKAVCIGVPGVIKGAFIFGAEYGQGVHLPSEVNDADSGSGASPAKC